MNWDTEQGTKDMAINLKTSPRDIAITIALLAGLVAYFAYTWTDIQGNRALLESQVTPLVDEFYKGLNQDEHEWLADVQSGKTNYIFGKDWGVIRFYSRKKGDVEMNSFIGLERFFDLTDGAWRETDFAKMSHPDHIYNAYQYFEDHGHGVSDEAYKKYSR
jgi:hypothetical protein